MRLRLLLVLLLAKLTETCTPTRSSTPIVCPCATDEVELINGDSPNSIQPVGTVAAADGNGCPTEYTVSCTSTTGGTVNMRFQESVSAVIQATSVNLMCTDGNWHYTDETNGVILVVSVQCQST